MDPYGGAGDPLISESTIITGETGELQRPNRDIFSLDIFRQIMAILLLVITSILECLVGLADYARTWALRLFSSRQLNPGWMAQ